MAYNHRCKVCDKGYNACDTCVNEMNYAAWRAIACEQAHFQAYMVLHEYGSGLIKKGDAKEMLLNLNIDGWENYPEHNRVVIAEILQEEKASSKAPVEPLHVAEQKAEETPLPEAQTQPQAYIQPQKKPFDKYNNKYNKK